MKNYKEYSAVWDHESWKKRFYSGYNVDYREMRKAVWENTLEIVKDGGYRLNNGKCVSIETPEEELDMYASPPVCSCSRFYSESFQPSFKKLDKPAEITVVPDDCLDTAHRWVEEGLTVCVLNMANRHNPGGGVRHGSGAQEEYLFRCSDYYRSLYRFVEYGEQYHGVETMLPGPFVHEYDKEYTGKYPLDRNYGGIFSKDVTVFRANERSGYELLENPWKVNMIAVAGMNSPRLEIVDGQERVAASLVNGVKNKLRTILRIACDNRQRCLVLGAIGCGAFGNPPGHIAELYREVLCEEEFLGAFERICFAVKADHNSHGDSNYIAFRNVLHGFVPPMEPVKSPAVKVAIGRDLYIVLKENGTVDQYTCHTGTKAPLEGFINITDIAAGFDHFIGTTKDHYVIFGGECKQTKHARQTHWDSAASVYACEAHSAMIGLDGRVRAAEDIVLTYPGLPQYAGMIEQWYDMKQLALLFELPCGLNNSGEFICPNRHISNFFNSSANTKIKQIDAFGCYYSVMTFAALYDDGTVRAMCDGEEFMEARDWRDIVKVVCGNRTLAALDSSGRVFFDNYSQFKDRSGNSVKELNNIKDIDMNFMHFVALTDRNEIIYLCDR